jgi:hypothetical protein
MTLFLTKKNVNLLQIIFMMAHLIQLWAYLLSQKLRDAMTTGCNVLLMVARDILCQAGWQHISRLEDA